MKRIAVCDYCGAISEKTDCNLSDEFGSEDFPPGWGIIERPDGKDGWEQTHVCGMCLHKLSIRGVAISVKDALKI